MRSPSRKMLSHLAGCGRRGAILILTALLLIVILIFASFAIDLGFICLASGETQHCADAAALAAAGKLYPDPQPQTAIQLPLSLPLYQPVIPLPDLSDAASSAQQIAARNAIADVHNIAVLDSDVAFEVYRDGTIVGPPATLGLVDDLLDFLNLRTDAHTFVNACTVRVRRDDVSNGPLSLALSPCYSQRQHSLARTATAAIQRGYGLGPGDKMLPFAMDVTIWNALRFTNGEINAVTLKPLGIDLDAITLSGLLGPGGLLALLDSKLPLALSGSPINVLDEYGWTYGENELTVGPDGVWEVVLLADQLTILNKLGLLGKLLSSVQRVPGLVVSLETASSGGAAPNAARLNAMIRNGWSLSEIQTHSTTNDGQVWLPFSMQGYFEVPDACEADLRAIIGQPRILPLYATLPGTVNKVTDILGMPHTFQFVGWGAVVITEVNLSGPVRYLNLQPATYARHTIEPASGVHAWRRNAAMSDGVFTTPRLIQ